MMVKVMVNTQKLMLRTIQYIEAMESLRLTVNLSNYVVAVEMHTIIDEAEEAFRAILACASAIHARVSNGEQVQVRREERRTSDDAPLRALVG